MCNMLAPLLLIPLFIHSSMLVIVMFDCWLPYDYADALDSMARVADHINEMKRISDTYYSLFEEMLKESKLAEVGYCGVFFLYVGYHST